MSYFYGVVQGQGQTAATRRGSKRSGLRVTAASYAGAVTVELDVDLKGQDVFVVRQEPWHGAGLSQEIARGVIGAPTRKRQHLQASDDLETAAQAVIDNWQHGDLAGAVRDLQSALVGGTLAKWRAQNTRVGSYPGTSPTPSAGLLEPRQT